MNQVYYTGPVAKVVGAADIGLLVGGYLHRTCLPTPTISGVEEDRSLRIAG
jgi:hypothetical protein